MTGLRRTAVVGSLLATACVAGLAAGPSAMTSPPPASPRTLPFDNLPRHAQTHFNFVVLGVADSDRAVAFYTTVLGMRERGRAQPDLRHFEVIVGFDGEPLTTGISLKYRDGPPQPRGNGSSAINLVVTDLPAIVARVETRGGLIRLPYVRRDTPAMSYGYATIEDPDGNAIELVEYLRLPPAPAR